METYYSLKVLHVLVASIWVGAGLLAPRDVGEALRAGPAHVSALMHRLRATAKVMNSSAMLTVVTGLALVLAGGGFGVMPMRINVGLGLTVLAYAVGRWLVRPSILEIARRGISSIAEPDARRMTVNFTRAVNTEHVLRLAVLVLMVYPVAL